MFVDRAKIIVKAGNGGNGCESYYQDKYNMRGFPDGGDGGRGADIVARADRNLRTLIDLQYKRHFIGRHGGHGSSKNQRGKDAAPVIIKVPCGTIIRDMGIDCLLGELDTDGQELIVAHGGKGGRGNQKNRQRSFGAQGDEKELLFDLKLLADVGLVGFPNAGKSTLISQISNAAPKIASYPFTTKAPMLGVVAYEDKEFVVADIPGLIEGSSTGRGLGDRFLRHIERTKVLVHMIDMAGSDGRDPLEDYRVINRELKGYSPAVFKKRQVIAANKMDLDAAEANLKRFRKSVKKKVYPVSALKKEGLEELIEAIGKEL
ncbi:MAG TPA: GTPase ObgE [Candidatus Omnitrophota bacterium]|nr:GTPase ObgE [Candidatus Omnitrophota bacterium]HQQ06659.1 GTPase ObgE [Candidatus Omnitrophota bacterium]